MSDQPPIIFFDGYCGLCDQFVSRVLRDPGASQFRFAPLQGVTFQNVLKELPALAAIDSLIVIEGSEGNRKAHVRSDASVFIGSRMKSGWLPALSKVTRLFPRPLRDFGYRTIAGVRYRVWGKRDTCRLPSPEERALFLP